MTPVRSRIACIDQQVRAIRLSALLVLLAAGAALVACGGDEEDGVAAGTIEDLPSEARLIVGATGAVPFDGDAAQFLAILPFQPLLPDTVPGDRTLATATIIPSREATGKADLEATLMLEYRGGDETTVQLTEERQPMSDMSALTDETVSVGDVEGALISFEESKSLKLAWHDCDITLEISTSAIDRDAMVEMAESITDECPDAVG